VRAGETVASSPGVLKIWNNTT